VIRHGESETNATNTFQAGNQYDTDPLTPLGAEDADRLAQRLASCPSTLSSVAATCGRAAPPPGSPR
jgi:broad specificity phosphatase PhoE